MSPPFSRTGRRGGWAGREARLEGREGVKEGGREKREQERENKQGDGNIVQKKNRETKNERK